MKKEEYIYYRNSNGGMNILFNYAIEHGYKRNEEKFNFDFVSWNINGVLKQKLLETIVDFYDTKFNVVLITLNNKLIKIE